MIYNVERVIEIGGDVIDRLHFDEAWYAYARFNPIYRGRYAMFGDPAEYKDGPTLFSTHSTHKLLAALSQASFIHIRDGRDPIEHARFNESFMMHASTSPFYPIIASNEISAAMMDGPSGVALTTESILEAVSFRQTVGRIKRQYAQANDWFFSTWNPTEITDPATGQRVAFEDAPEEELVREPSCWVLHPGEAWHGFEGLEDGYCMLDPIKVTVGRQASPCDRLVRAARHPGCDYCGLSRTSSALNTIRLRTLTSPLALLHPDEQGQEGNA